MASSCMDVDVKRTTEIFMKSNHLFQGRERTLEQKYDLMPYTFGYNGYLYFVGDQ